MLSIRFFLDNILPAARKQRFRKASKGSFDTPSIKSKKGFCAGKNGTFCGGNDIFPSGKEKHFRRTKKTPFSANGVFRFCGRNGNQNA